MNNAVQNLIELQMSLHQQQSSSGSTVVDTQLQLNHMNWIIQKFYQDQMMLLQKLQQLQQARSGEVAGIVTPPSPPGSSIAEEHPVTEDPVVQHEPAKSHRGSPNREECAPQQEAPAVFMPTTVLESIPLSHARTERTVRFNDWIGPTRPEKSFVRVQPYQMQRKRNSVLSAVTVNAPIEVDLKYHENMARWFSDPAETCTPEEKKRRQRNTEAARLSRAKTRTLCTLLEKESAETAEQNRDWKIVVAQKRMYVNQLLQLLGMPQRDLTTRWEPMGEDETISSEVTQ